MRFFLFSIVFLSIAWGGDLAPRAVSGSSAAMLVGGAAALAGGARWLYKQARVRNLRGARKRALSLRESIAFAEELQKEKRDRKRAALAAGVGLATAGAGWYFSREKNFYSPPASNGRGSAVVLAADPDYIRAADLEQLPGWQAEPYDIEEVSFSEEGVTHYRCLQVMDCPSLGRDGGGGNQQIVLDGSHSSVVAEKLRTHTVAPERVSLRYCRRLKDLAPWDLSVLGETPQKIEALKALWLSGNRLERLPVGIERLTHLEKLCLDNNCLGQEAEAETSTTLARFARLKEKLCLRSNRFSNLRFLSALPALRAVDARGNRIAKFEREWIASSGNLVSIDVDARVQLPLAWCRRELLPEGDQRPLIVRADGRIFVSNPYRKPIVRHERLRPDC